MKNKADLISLLRPDLHFYFNPSKTSQSIDYDLWLVQSGIKEYQFIKYDNLFIKKLRCRAPGIGHQFNYLQYLIWVGRVDLQKSFPLPKYNTQYLEWFYTHGILEYDIWSFLTPQEKKLTLENKGFWAPRLNLLKEITKIDLPALGPNTNLLGVNLIGYIYGQLGIGEDLRMAAKALIDTQISISLINFPPGEDIPLIAGKIEIEHFANKKYIYSVNIFCMTAEETARFYAERGSSQFCGHYNIGYWPWELSKWPQEWRMLLSLVDEIWVSTKHTYDALKKVYKGPLFLMPMAVHLGKIGISSSKNKIREHFSLPKNAKLFCFSFDLNSSIYRKNPQGCIKAFLEAFPKKEFSPSEVGLVIKTHKPKGVNKDWQQLKRLASKDDRIHIIEDTLTREDLLALYKACDCFLSLHRAEGFGRGIAEALQLGLHIITTGYSGNMDFCKKPCADLVDYKLIKVGPGQYPRSNNQVWADPDISHAASLMKKFALKKQGVKSIKSYPQFSPEVVGKRYQKRLEEIMKMLKKSPKLAHPLSK